MWCWQLPVVAKLSSRLEAQHAQMHHCVAFTDLAQLPSQPRKHHTILLHQVCSCQLDALGLGLGLAGQTLGLASLNVNLGEPAAGLDELNDIDDVLGKHDGETEAGEDPGDGRVHLVGAGELEGGGAEGVGEELLEQGGVHGGAGLDVGAARLLDRLDEVGREERRGKGEEVEGDEEEFVEAAKDEEDSLVLSVSGCTANQEAEEACEAGRNVKEAVLRTLLV